MPMVVMGTGMGSSPDLTKSLSAQLGETKERTEVPGTLFKSETSEEVQSSRVGQNCRYCSL